MKIAFLTTIFPMKIEYLIDFFDSLLKQTYKGFDIIVINDGYDNFKFLLKNYSELNIIELRYQSTPAKNREYGINYVMDKEYDILIFGDSDDYFSDNRVEKSLLLLEENDIVVNDLTLFDENGIYEKEYFSHRIKNNTIIDSEFIKSKNIFGLTNTALKIKNLEKISFQNDIVAVDWLFFGMLLKLKKKAIFTNRIKSFYRQYDTNTIGLNNQDGQYLFWWEKE